MKIILSNKIAQIINHQLILQNVCKRNAIQQAIFYALALVTIPSVNALENPNLISTNTVANARGEQIILMDDEELIPQPNSTPAVKQPINANEIRPSKVNSKAIYPVKLKNEKKVATKQRSGIKPATGENAIISKLEFKQANMIEVARALADMSGLNVVATDDAAKKNVTVFLQNVTVKDALDTITKNSGLWYRQDKLSKTYRIMTTDEYQRDMVIYREDTTRIFNVLHPNPVIVATAIRDIYGDRVRLSLGAEDTTSMQSLNGDSSQRTITSTVTRNSNRTRSTYSRTETNQSNRNQGYGGNQDDSNVAIKDRLTPEQLQKLGDRLAEYGDIKTISSDALKGISSSEQPIFITLNREHDLIVVRTSDTAAMAEIERLIKDMDKPTKQVLLEMKILSLDVGDAYRQAFDLDYVPNNSKVYGPPTDQDKTPLFTAAPENATTTETYPTATGGTTTVTQTGVITSGVRNVLGLGNFALEGGTFVYQFMNDKIRARIQLLQTNNKINTLSSPILLATNNKPAKVFVGTEQVITTGFDAVAGGANAVSTGSPAIIPVTEVRNVGNTLQIMPKINADGTVTLMIQQDSSTIVQGASSIPVAVGSTVQRFSADAVKTSNIQGTVVAKDGLTVAIGGLIDSTESEEEQKVPLLGDIPIVGELFKRKAKTKGKRELLLLITPHIIATPQEAEDLTRDAIEPISDQEW